MLRTTRLAKNSSSSMADNAGVGSTGGDREDETVKRLPLTSKNLNRATGYLTPDAKRAFT